MDKMEKVELLRAKTNVSYEEARNVLEETGWDLLDAIILLERRGMIRNSSEQAPEIQEEAPEVQEEVLEVQEEVPVIQEEVPEVQEEAPAVQEKTPEIQEEAPAKEPVKAIGSGEPAAAVQEEPSIEEPALEDEPEEQPAEPKKEAQPVVLTLEDVTEEKEEEKGEEKMEKTGERAEEGARDTTRQQETAGPRRGKVRKAIRHFFSLLRKGSFRVDRKGENLLVLPAWLFAIIFLVTLRWIILVMVAALFFGFRYSFQGGELEKANEFMDKASDLAEDVKADFRKR